MVQNPYEVLGVSRGAGMDEIKRAYRKKAKECHPDLHPDDPTANARMQQVNEAYDMLCNPEKYASRQQARPNPGAQGGYAGYGGQAWQRQSGQGGPRYTYYYTDARDDDAWRTWQSAWSNAGSGAQRQSAPALHPFRGVLRLVGGLLLFRFLMTLLRVGLFGFFI